jgi:hypothetical protein
MTAYSSETLVPTFQINWNYKAENHNINLYCSGNLSSYKDFMDE